MHPIVTHLWFDREARDAAALYTSIFPDSRILDTSTLSGTPSGDIDIVNLVLAGRPFQFLAAGPYFTFTPAISFLVSCPAREDVDRVWEVLHVQGKELMPLGSYDFSDRYGWTTDRFGLSWQVMLADEKTGTTGSTGTREGSETGGPAITITPTLMFTGAVCGKASEAVTFYTSHFEGSRIEHLIPYGPGAEPDSPDSIKHAAFTLGNQAFAAMDSAYEHGFGFNEAISFIQYCETQEEIDHHARALSAVPGDEQCGWLKDRYGLSWQIVPLRLEELMRDPDPAKRERVTQAMLGMKRLDIAGLEAAAAG